MSAAQHHYDSVFFDYVDRGALRSARVVVPIVVQTLGCRSVLDVGCGSGAWLSVYRDQGVEEIVGVDGDYVDRRRLMIPQSAYRAVDVGRDFTLDRTFDLVQSLEVAEHIAPSQSRTIVSNLVRHGSTVLFSAAVPGQGGEHHTNERPYEFWHALFAEHGYAAYDCVRPQVRGNRLVEPWYAYNSIVYVRSDRAASLTDAVRQTRVPDGRPIPNVAPLSFRLRAALLRPLPVGVVTRIAVARHRFTRTRDRRQQR
jgi:SAM-dependent methyltransferase